MAGMALSQSFKDLCAVAPVQIQPKKSPLGLGDGIKISKRSTASDLLQEKLNVKAGLNLIWFYTCIFRYSTFIYISTMHSHGVDCASGA
jgi:hypothetical protein